MKFRVVVALFSLIVSYSALAEETDPPELFSFALMGDMPYSEDEEPQVEALIDRINSQPLQFVVHIGDFKNGHSVCSDEVFQKRLALFSRSRHPFIYTPGDNEWTDCHRWTNGGYDPVERLNRLREMFYPNAQTLGQNKLPVQRQSADPRFAAYRENARWRMQGVLFVTINVPGSNNNFGQSAPNDDEYHERSAANREWLREAFRLAKSQDVLGLAIFFQADPAFQRMLSYKPSNGYRELVAQLARQSRALNKPVLLGHGDTHRYRVDRPLRDQQSGATIANALRVETFGSPFINWVRITVDPADPQLFRVQPGK